MSLSERERRAILNRDGHKSRMLHYSEERGWHTGGYCGDGCDKLEVHHICPDRVGKSEGKKPEQINSASNLVTLYKCEHAGVCPERKVELRGKFVTPTIDTPVIHEDTLWAFQNYEGKTQFNGVKGLTSFDIMIQLRDQSVDEGEVYWNDDWDDMLREIAETTTRCAAAAGWRYPSPNKRKEPDYEPPPPPENIIYEAKK